jgi:hypothetical protein
MSRFSLTRPSLQRAVLSISAVTAVSCAITGIALAIAYTHGLTDPAPVGDYIRLFITFVVLWGPMYLLFFWWATIPFVIGLGALVAFARRGDAVNGSVAPRPDGHDCPGKPDDPRQDIE